MKVVVFLALSALAAVLCYELDGGVGLAGATCGIVFALVLCLASHFAVWRVRTVAPRLLPSTMLLGVTASFLLMGVFVQTLATVKREILLTATLTALAL